MKKSEPPSQANLDSLITPVDYEPPTETIKVRRRPARHQIGIGAIFAVALLMVWFLLSSRAIELELLPADTHVTLSGGPSLAIGSRVLLRPGAYSLRLAADGYEPLERNIQVNSDSGQKLSFQLVPLPGLLQLETTPAVVQVRVDDEERGSNEQGPIQIAAGMHTLVLHADRYLPHTQDLEIQGRNIRQPLRVELQPAWGVYGLQSEPAGARIDVDGEPANQTTPASLELLAGAHEITLHLDGYASAALKLVAVAGEQLTLEQLALQRADTAIEVRSQPSGASVTLDGIYQGVTPLHLAFDGARTHKLIAFKAGYAPAQHQIGVGKQRQQAIDLKLGALLGEVRIQVLPADAELRANGRLLGRGSQTLQLSVGTRSIEVSRSGYATEQLAVTPRPGFTQTLGVKLRTREEKRIAQFQPRIRTALGQELVLIKPGDFSMGSSRREPGRRSHETLRAVKMQRLYYLGVTEVSNAEFRRFRAAHSSSHFKRKSLNGDKQPAVALSWQEAASFCNWLSQQEGLAPFYATEQGIVIGINPSGHTGYRLPSEAEWEWAARVLPDGGMLRFSWGAELPPPAGAGNFADSSGAALLGEVISGYDDGFAVAAPVASFKPNRLGLFDIGGNAAEWVHDYYDSGAAAATLADPLGPEIGDFHVIRGPSWRHGTLSDLRLAARDFGKDGRPDLGFRVARYAQ